MNRRHHWPDGWSAVVDYLEHAGVTTVFGLPADDVGLLAALQPTAIRMVLCRDQRNATFMATGHALQSGRPAVCVVGKGPAVTNTVTGLLEARAAAVPLVVLAAGTSAEHRGTGALQELDQLSLIAPLVKWAARVDHPNRLMATLEKAFLVAAGGVPGPVYLELPDQLLGTEVVRARPWATLAAPVFPADQRISGAALAAIEASERPIVLVGGGLRHGNADAAVERLAAQVGAAVFVTASGRGAIDEDHPLFCGLAGLYSAPEMAALWAACDLVVSFGSRLEETATYPPGFAPAGTSVVQVNLDSVEFSTDHPGPQLIGDAGRTAADWSAVLPAGQRSVAESWVAAVQASRSAATARVGDELKAAAGEPQLSIPELLAALDRVVPADRVLVQENGLADMWSYFYPYYSCHADGGSIVPSEQTTLGFGAAAAAGVALAAAGRPVVALVGDGAFAMVRNDLSTLVEQRIPVLYLVLDNGGYGWLQTQLDGLADGNSRFRFVTPDPDLGPPAPAGVHAARVTDRAELDRQLAEALAACAEGRVAVLQVPVRLYDAALAGSEHVGTQPEGLA